MNNRMYELINQSFVGTTDGKLSDRNTIANIEKFARLIVSECCQYLNSEAERLYMLAASEHRPDFIQGIKDHFGIEE